MNKLINKYQNPAKKLTDFDEMNNYAQEDTAEFYEKNAYYDHQDDWGRRLRNIGLENKRSEISSQIFDKLYNTNIVDENNSVGELNYPLTDIKDDKNRDIYTKLIYGYNHSIGKALPKEINDWNKKLVNGSLMTEFMRPAAVAALIKSKKLNIPLEEYLNDPRYENDMDVIELKKLFKDNNGNVDTKKMFYFLDNFAQNNNPQQFNDSPLYAKRGARLIPKAQLGTLLKKGLTWIGNHMAPTQEQTMFQHWNNQRSKLETKPKEKSGQSNPIEELQKQLADKGFYTGKIDGRMGPKMRSAITMANIKGYEVKDNKLVRKQYKKENIKQLMEKSRIGRQSGGTHSLNNPLLRSIQDFFQARTYNSRPTWDPYTSGVNLPKREAQTITSIPLNQDLVLQELIKSKGTPKKGSWTASDWKQLQGNYTGGNRSVFQRNFGPLASIEHCLGQFDWYTNNDGEIVVTDTFDWNVGSSSEKQGWYTKARDFMGEYGTSSDAPKDEKTKYKINLGNPKNW